MNKIRIFDMDGCIVNSLHRYRTITDPDGRVRIDLQYWRDNEFRAMGDSLLPLAAHYQACLRDPGCFTVIATARVMNEPDYQFVREVLGEPNRLISRLADDSRSGGLLKVLGLRKLFALKQFAAIQDIVFFEDNIQYLRTVCDEFGIMGVYIPSEQGH